MDTCIREKVSLCYNLLHNKQNNCDANYNYYLNLHIFPTSYAKNINPFAITYVFHLHLKKMIVTLYKYRIQKY